jgi:lipoate-protein ligase B
MNRIINPPGVLLCYDRLGYAAAWNLQRLLIEERTADRRPDTVVLLEHDSVFTIGRSGQADHWGGNDETLSEAGYPVYHVERGGSVTYHGPGQIVGYPILRLSRFCPGPKAYIRLLEEVLIRTLAGWGIRGERIEKLPGVWVSPDSTGRLQKIASMGVRIAKGVTMHGFALNVTVDLEPFHRIIPCGITGCQMTSMSALLGRPVDVALVRRRTGEQFAEVFRLEWIEWDTGHEPSPGPVPSEDTGESETSGARAGSGPAIVCSSCGLL